MDLSSNRSQDEDRIMQRQLYRAGQNQSAQTPASGASKPASSSAAKAKHSSGSSSSKWSADKSILTPSQRRKLLIGLGVSVWLLLLGTISYFLSLPNLDALNQERMALFQDNSLTPEERREKLDQLREKEKNLTPAERKQMWEMSRKERTRKMNRDTFDFLKLSPEAQVAQLKKEDEQRRKFFEEMRKMRGNKGGKGNRGNGPGGNAKGGPGGGGPPGGGWGGGGSGADMDRPAALGQKLDSRSPEARAGAAFKGAMMQQMGLGFGGRGGFGGPGGGGGGGGKGGGR